jgi:hypothetical protein
MLFIGKEGISSGITFFRIVSGVMTALLTTRKTGLLIASIQCGAIATLKNI